LPPSPVFVWSFLFFIFEKRENKKMDEGKNRKTFPEKQKSNEVTL
jgi:hypothetical protein